MCKECKEHKEFKEYKMPYIANGNRLYYNSFDELTDDLKDKYRGKETKQGKETYIGFINKLNENGDKLVSDYVNNSTKVRIRYGKCGHEHTEEEGVTPNKYKIGRSCGICCGKIVVKGINDIATTHPQYIKYFINIKDAYTHTYASHDKVEMKCPICGTIKVMIIKNLTSHGFGCIKCGDGVSYSEKLMALVLEKLGVEFTRQVTYNNGKHRYDFYIELWKVIYETHGIQHYEGWCHNKEDLLWQEANDENKRYNAIHFLGVKNEDYHEIDCRYSTLEWCRPNIEKALSKYIDASILTDEDWKEFDRQAQKSLKVEACLYWKEQKEANEDLTITIMANIFNVSKDAIRNWLKWGNESGLCTYSGEEERKANKRRISKFVYLIKPNVTKWYDEATSQKELARLTGITRTAIGNRLKDGKPLGSKGAYNVKYDSKYIGSYVVEEDKLEEFSLNLKGGDIIE